LPAKRVKQSLDQTSEWRGTSNRIRCEDGPEYISRVLAAWAEEQGITLPFIKPGNPWQNAYVERYNRTVRYDWFSKHLFDSIEEVQEHATRWPGLTTTNDPIWALPV
jgi:putative transposase